MSAEYIWWFSCRLNSRHCISDTHKSTNIFPAYAFLVSVPNRKFFFRFFCSFCYLTKDKAAEKRWKVINKKKSVFYWEKRKFFLPTEIILNFQWLFAYCIFTYCTAPINKKILSFLKQELRNVKQLVKKKYITLCLNLV